MKLAFLAVPLLLGACGAPPATSTPADAPRAAPAAPAAPTAHETFVDAQGLAIHGYDPVSYFDGAPAQGDPEFATQRDGARYVFATAANKARFDANPDAFTPQFGGYCAYGAAAGHKSPTEADTGQIINGKLYFNYNKAVQAKFDKDRAGYIAQAEQNWPTIKNDTP